MEARSAVLGLDTREVYESLKAVVEDDGLFDAALEQIFCELDLDQDNALDATEFQHYLTSHCKRLGIRDAPTAEQVAHVIHYMDLNRDNVVNKDEMCVFLRHVFQEQLLLCAGKLKLPGFKHRGTTSPDLAGRLTRTPSPDLAHKLSKTTSPAPPNQLKGTAASGPTSTLSTAASLGPTSKLRHAASPDGDTQF